MKTYKVNSKKATPRKKKDPILLVKPTEPKAPPKPKPVDIWNALSSDKHDELDNKLIEFARELGKKLGGRMVSRWGDEELLFIDSEGSENGLPDFTSTNLRIIADEMDEFIKTLPGIPETKRLELVNYDWDFAYQAESLPDLTKIAETNRRYNEAKERYEKNLAIYNSPASKKARETRDARILAAKQAVINKKKERLLKQLRELDV